MAEPQVFDRREERRQRRVVQVFGRHAVHGACRQQENPGAENERKGQRVDFPRGHHVVETRAHPGSKSRAEDERQPHPERVAQEGREGAAYQNAVEAPEALRTVVGRQPQEASRQRRYRRSHERSPGYDTGMAGIGTPEYADEKEQSRPCAGLEHHLSRTAQ